MHISIMRAVCDFLMMVGAAFVHHCITCAGHLKGPEHDRRKQCENRLHPYTIYPVWVYDNIRIGLQIVQEYVSYEFDAMNPRRTFAVHKSVDQNRV